MSGLGPPEFGGETRRLLRTAALVVGVLLFGALALALIAGALKVSQAVGFGVWGAVAVVAIAALVGAVALIRSARARRAGQAVPEVRKAPSGRVVALPKRLSDALEGRGAAGAAPVPGSAAHTPGLGTSGLGTPGLGGAAPSGANPGREAYFRALESGDLTAAATAVARLRAGGESTTWCDNAERRIEHLRRRG